MFAENDEDNFTLKRFNEINNKEELDEADIKFVEAFDQKYTEAKRKYDYKWKDELIENYRKHPLNYFHDFVNNMENGKKLKLVDRLKPEVYKAVFEENQEWFDAMHVVKNSIHSSVLYKINFFTSEVKNEIMSLILKDNFFINVTVDGDSFYHHQVVAATF
jgi:cytochrome b involved in lipid metabolism